MRYWISFTSRPASNSRVQYEWFYEKPGHWRSIYTHNYYQSKAEAEQDKIGAAIGILFNEAYKIDVPLDAAAYYLGGDMDAANAFSEQLKERGYSGVIQSKNGDEIVIFDASNIKSADPVTYDDKGNVIPLSERFNEKKSDIRFSKKSGNEKLNIDNAEKSSYNGSKNKNGGDQYDGNRVDRGVAEGVSLRQVSDRTEASERYGENGRGNQELPRKHLSHSLYKAFKESGVVATELYDYSENSAAYSYALDAARSADKDNGWCVTPQSAEDLAGKKLRMDANGSIGYVLADGDIEGVFKNPKTNTTRRALGGVIPQALSEGGTKLDCYGDGLVAVYEAYGFIPVARIEFNPEYANSGWDESKGRPFIYMMMHNWDSAEAVVRNIGQYEHMSLEQLEALPTYDKNGYDEAAAYRDGAQWRKAYTGRKYEAHIP